MQNNNTSQLVRPQNQRKSQAVINDLPIVDIDPNFDYIQEYINITGRNPVTNYHFGALDIEPYGDKVFFGISGGLPAQGGAGAYVAGYDDSTGNMVGIDALSEEGVNTLVISDYHQKLFIGGADAYEPWTAANFYSYDLNQPFPGTIIKHRDETNGITNSISVWDIYVDEDSGEITVGTGGHNGECPGVNCDNTDWRAPIFRSNDAGNTWNLVSQVSTNRVYLVTKHNSKFYAVATRVIFGPPDYASGLELYVSEDNGLNWNRLTDYNDDPLDYNRFKTLNGRLFILGNSPRENIYEIHDNNTLTKHSLPFTAPGRTSQLNEVDTSGYAYSAGDDGTVYQSHNLSNWCPISNTGLQISALRYWEEKNSLLLGERQTGNYTNINPRIWSMDLDQLSPIESTVDGYIWEDENQNSNIDEDENVLPDTEVIIYIENGVEINRTSSDENGYFAFEGIKPDRYFIEYNPYYVGTISPLVPGADSKAEPGTRLTEVFDTGCGDDILNMSAGIYDVVFPPTPLTDVISDESSSTQTSNSLIDTGYNYNYLPLISFTLGAIIFITTFKIKREWKN